MTGTQGEIALVQGTSSSIGLVTAHGWHRIGRGRLRSRRPTSQRGTNEDADGGWTRGRFVTM